jgi:hypothetical protein
MSGRLWSRRGAIAIVLALTAGCAGDIEPYEIDEAEPDLDDGQMPGDEPDGDPDAELAPAGTDAFGVRKLYPSVAGGREWRLPANGHVATNEWSPSNGSRGTLKATNEPGVFRTRGGPRFPVTSPQGKAWFRNVEVTSYYRMRAKLTGADEISPLGNYGFQLIVRGERHLTGTVSASSINRGVAPPAATVAGPGYPFNGGSVNAHCLAASYHTNINVDGRVLFKKEISHTGGYTGGRNTVRPFASGGAMPMNRWFGIKYVVRNSSGGGAVRMETWLDVNATGQWAKVGETTDQGGWTGTSLDGCGAAPFHYAADQIITWAGPSVLFRFDNIEADVKWLSVREIAPLP